MNKKMSFFIVGAAKSGTSLLWTWMRRHPQIFMPATKEPNYFALSRLNRFHFGSELDVNYKAQFILDEKEYDALCNDAPENTLCGEASPSYLYFQHSADLIRQYNPNAKIIAILRNPVERAFSQFRHHRRDGYEPAKTFQEALEREEKRIEQGWWWGFHYRNAGMYTDQWQRYCDAFPATQRLILEYDLLARDPHGTCQRICDFLNIPFTKDIVSNARENDTSQLRTMPANGVIERWLRHPSPLRRTVKSLLPAGICDSARDLMRTMNTAPSPDFPETVRASLNHIFEPEIASLSHLTKLDLST